MVEETELARASFPKVDRATWEEKVEAALKGRSAQSLESPSGWGAAIQALYTDRPDVDHGLPGGFPFCRGPSATGRRWCSRQEYGHPDVEVAAAQFASDRAGGVQSAWFHVGVEDGVRVLSPGDIDTLIGDANLSEAAIVWDTGASAFAVTAAVCAVAKSRGVALNALTGGWGADPLGQLTRAGTLAGGWRGEMKLVGELASFSAAHTPKMRSMLVSAVPFHRAGASPVQELAWSLSAGVAYMRVLTEAGFSVAQATEQIQLSYAVDTRTFLAIAKLRAARMLWARMLELSGVPPQAALLPMHVVTSLRGHARWDRWVNVLRATTQAFSAVVGGADSVSVAPFDVLHGGESGLARRVARNVHHIFESEAQLSRVADPAGGSYYVENLTRSLCEEAWSEFQGMESRGGIISALRSGEVRRALQVGHRVGCRAVGRGQASVVGVSVFPNAEEEPPPVAAYDLRDVEARLGRELPDAPTPAQDALMGFVQAMQERDAEPGSRLREAVNAMFAGVDIFSLSALMRAGHPSLHLEPAREFLRASEWERLRDVGEVWRHERGERYPVFCIEIGDGAALRTRLAVARCLCEAGGVEPVLHQYVDEDQTIAACTKRGARLAIVCADDDSMGKHAARLVAGLVKGPCRAVAVMDPPKEHQPTLARDSATHIFLDGSDLLVAFDDFLRAGGGRR